MLPQSPRKIVAGGKLKNKKPSSEPASATRDDGDGELLVETPSPRSTADDAAIAAEQASRPSIRSAS